MSEQFEEINRRKIVLLIDGDNAQPSLINKMLAETGKIGSITIRRIYGDWTTPNMNGWKETLTDNAIQPIQQFRNTVGKNATDSAMIIDAMEILYSGHVDGFSIVSSDSDYTRLATKIRENGLFVMGIGKQQTPQAFIKACDRFIYTEILISEECSQKDKTLDVSILKIVDKQKMIEAIPLMKQAFEMAAGDDGWAHLGAVGNHLRELNPGFDPRTYGYKQLSQLFIACPKLFELKHDQESKVCYVRLKE